MRQSLVVLSAALPLATLLSGCSASMQNNWHSVPATATSLTRTLSGKAHGGQQPVSNGAIAVYAYGTSGCGAGSVRP